MNRSLTYVKMGGPDESPPATESQLTQRCRLPVRVEVKPDDDAVNTISPPPTLLPGDALMPPPSRPLSPPSSPTPSTNNACDNTIASTSPLIDCRQLADEVSPSYSPPSPTTDEGRGPPGFSRPVKNPTELDKKVRHQQAGQTRVV